MQVIRPNGFVAFKLPVNWGHWLVWVQIAVRGTYGWEFTPWVGTSTYQNFNQIGTLINASQCWASLTV